MGFPFFENLDWAVEAGLEVLVITLAFRRRLYHRQPLFTFYFVLLILNEIVITSVYARFGTSSYTSFYSYWAAQAVLVTARGSSVFEVFKVLLSPFAGVWRTCRIALFLIATLITSASILAASRSGPLIPLIISTLQRGVELAIVGVLLFGLAFCRYYQVQIPNYLILIGSGFGFYSAVQIVNNTFWGKYLLNYFSVWKDVGLVSFNVAMILWAFALRNPLPSLALAPARLSPGAYEALAPQMSSRMRELNSRLLEMWK